MAPQKTYKASTVMCPAAVNTRLQADGRKVKRSNMRSRGAWKWGMKGRVWKRQRQKSRKVKGKVRSVLRQVIVRMRGHNGLTERRRMRGQEAVYV